MSDPKSIKDCIEEIRWSQLSSEETCAKAALDLVLADIAMGPQRRAALTRRQSETHLREREAQR